MRTTLILTALLALQVGCSSPTPEPNLYLMRGEAVESSGRVDASARVGLGRLVVAPYLLASRGIVVEVAPGEVRAARQHQWAETLDAGLRWFLRGGSSGPNYDSVHIRLCEEALEKAGVKQNIMVDCSHANDLGVNLFGLGGRR